MDVLTFYILLVQVNGVVQGVNFRAWTKKQASTYNISGFIRNADEGHVEGEAFGSAQSMDNLCAINRHQA